MSIKEAVYIKVYYKNSANIIKLTSRYKYTNNNGVLLLAKNPIFHECTKHIAVKFHYIRELINKRIINLYYITSINNQKADGLIKLLERIRF